MNLTWMNEFTFRPNSQDVVPVRETLLGNEYRLPTELSSEDVVLDIGAHIGCFAADALRRGAGKVICYEPVPSNLYLLRKNLAPWGASRYEVVEAAVWESEGVAKFFDQRQHTACGFLDDTGSMFVKTTTIEKILEPHTLVRFLKIDGEGCEWQALLHGTQLTKCVNIAAELHCDGPDDKRVGEVVERLRGLGFAATAMPQRGHVNCWLLLAGLRVSP